ncbi:thiamine biosynthesis protein ThiS [Virgibacillus phasianinus]|uniref:Thiamine biosynthesis protein ThiS n=1 Tax=Virgibacillus phasianinus TaxID=2017483 RepID=A0A220U798_9BACI|nr:sulfur carrier protein ThiS [Virgibacillus phasianinus]ASK63915.1 thiamine biosynthesis protein ThiS [Virgibacillus phasianinus]
MNLTINGKVIPLPEDVTSVRDVMMHFNLNQQVVIVEHNGEILNREHHDHQGIKNGDKLELVQFVGGG